MAGKRAEGYGVAGFAARYDASRPRTAAVLVDLLSQYARVARPRLVVDLGCGTGHSTEVWLDRADAVVGIEMEPAMLAVAQRRVAAPNVEWRVGDAQHTGVADGAADVVTCVQAFHWMDPLPTLAGVARILRPGGVFAAVDWEMPAMDWEAEAADVRFLRNVRRLRQEHGLDMDRPVEGDRTFWPKAGHLESLRRSGHFRYVREVLLHGVEQGSAERLVLTATELAGEPWGALDELYERGVTDEALGLTAFREVAQRVIGDGCRWFIGYTVRLGVRG